MVGLLESSLINLTCWAPFVHGRAVYAQSSVRRFARWLDNERIDVHKLYGPLIQQALGSWGQPYAVPGVGYFAALGAILRHTHLNHLSGPAIPLVWQVIAHASSSVAYETYQALLDKAPRCYRSTVSSCFWRIAALLTQPSWPMPRGWVGIGASHQRLLYGLSPGHRRLKLSNYELKPGQAHFWHHVQITAEHYGPVHLALAHVAEMASGAGLER